MKKEIQDFNIAYSGVSRDYAIKQAKKTKTYKEWNKNKTEPIILDK